VVFAFAFVRYSVKHAVIYQLHVLAFIAVRYQNGRRHRTLAVSFLEALWNVDCYSGSAAMISKLFVTHPYRAHFSPAQKNAPCPSLDTLAQNRSSTVAIIFLLFYNTTP
jgi:hypothetical protein